MITWTGPEEEKFNAIEKRMQVLEEESDTELDWTISEDGKTVEYWEWFNYFGDNTKYRKAGGYSRREPVPEY